jgi:hypothetical protein
MRALVLAVAVLIGACRLDEQTTAQFCPDGEFVTPTWAPGAGYDGQKWWKLCREIPWSGNA